MPFMRVEKMN